jgi:hypothetical protein
MIDLKEIERLITAQAPSLSLGGPPVPAPLIFSGISNRPGVSAIEIAKNIIARQAEAGAPIGALPDGEPSVAERMEIIRVEEILKHLLSSAKITVSIPPGTPVQAAGVDATGMPVTVYGTTVGFSLGYAIIE